MISSFRSFFAHLNQYVADRDVAGVQSLLQTDFEPLKKYQPNLQRIGDIYPVQPGQEDPLNWETIIWCLTSGERLGINAAEDTLQKTEKILRLLEFPLEHPNKKELNLLSMALIEGSAGLCKVALRMGIDPNAPLRDRTGETLKLNEYVFPPLLKSHPETRPDELLFRLQFAVPLLQAGAHIAPLTKSLEHYNEALLTYPGNPKKKQAYLEQYKQWISDIVKIQLSHRAKKTAVPSP